MFGFRADSLSRLARYLDESTRSRGVSNGVGLGVGGPNSGWNPRWPVLWAETQFRARPKSCRPTAAGIKQYSNLACIAVC